VPLVAGSKYFFLPVFVAVVRFLYQADPPRVVLRFLFYMLWAVSMDWIQTFELADVDSVD